MQLASSGLVIDHFGDVLLVNNDGPLIVPTRTLIGAHLPPQAAALAVRETSSLIVMPVRLASLQFWPVESDGRLLFQFRCIMRGGELAKDGEKRGAGFFRAEAIPSLSPGEQTTQIAHGLHHQGGLPDFVAHEAPAPMSFWQRLIDRVMQPDSPPIPQPVEWKMEILILVRDQHERILWRHLLPEDRWELPGGDALALEAPWQAAQRIKSTLPVAAQIDMLNAVILDSDSTLITFVFSALAAEGEAANLQGYHFFESKLEQQPVRSNHLQIARKYSSSAQTTAFIWRSDLEDGPGKQVA